MSATPITDAANADSSTALNARARALTAAALTGPLVEDVQCPACNDCGWEHDNHRIPCRTCGVTGTVRLVVHVVTPDLAVLAQALREVADNWHGEPLYDAMNAAAAILDPQDGDR